MVIAGMSGKLPESENMQEFWANLIGGVDMVTDDDRRWKAGEWAACSACLPLLAAWEYLEMELEWGLGSGCGRPRVGPGVRPCPFYS